MINVSLGFSPCPNDTFVFDALIHNKIDTKDINFKVVMADVEDLNQRSFEEELDITKISFHALAYLTDSYQLLDAGSALGRNCGPLLIAKEYLSEARLNAARIAIPGRYTTANFLLSLAFPQALNKVEILFSDIEQAVLDNRFDAGLIIHENRFTFQDKGLVKIVDLGEYWETLTGMPIPLGGIAIKRKLPQGVKQTINELLKASVQFALTNPDSSLSYVKKHAQEMDEKVMYQHINLYVIEYTKNLGLQGRAAIREMYAIATRKGIISEPRADLFLSPKIF